MTPKKTQGAELTQEMIMVLKKAFDILVFVGFKKCGPKSKTTFVGEVVVIGMNSNEEFLVYK